MSTSTPTSTPDAVKAMRARLTGTVHLPDDDGYAAACHAWNVTFRHRPALVSVPMTVADVAELVSFARANGLRVAIQSTGHGVAATADDALLISTSNLDTVRVDRAARRAWVGAGATWAPVLGQAQEHGLAPLLGSSPHVGAVGYTLGGGMGWLARRYGMSSDSVHRFEVVTADGRVVTASATENTELFWGLRGAGAGSLGVVTGMEIELYPVTDVYGGNLIYPADMAADVMARWAHWIETVPDELTSAVTLMNFPPFETVPEPLRGKSYVLVRGCFDGPIEAGERLLDHWRGWRAPAMDLFGPLPFSQVEMISQDPVDPMPAAATGLWLRDLTPEVAAALVAGTFVVGGPPPLLFTEIRHAGGAIARVDATSSAYGNREALLSLEMIGLAPTPEIAAALEAHTGAIKDALAGSRTGGVYLNFLEGHEKRTSAASALGTASAQRAARLKAAVDPDNLFDRGLDLAHI